MNMNKKIPLNIDCFQGAVLICSKKGKIININKEFRLLFKWQYEELIDQNIGILIPSKFIRKHEHDKYLENYYVGKESKIIGKSRILPIKTSDDIEILSLVQIIMINSKKNNYFIATFYIDKIKITFFDNKELEEKIQESFKIFKKDYDFREIRGDQIEMIKLLYYPYIKNEIDNLIKFFIQNIHTKYINKVIYCYIMNPIDNLKSFRFLLLSYFESFLSYINIICLGIFFPLLNSLNIDGSIQNNLKKFIYNEYDNKIEEEKLTKSILNSISLTTSNPPNDRFKEL